MELSLLLVGRDGNGKSSTGNSILGGKHFTPTSSSSSVGVDIQQASAEVDGKVVTVTEIVGLEYPGTDNAGDIEKTLEKIKETIENNKNGFNAVIIVLKYGARFTKQEKDALLIIRSIFGSNVVKDCGVVVMTNGDCFDFDVEDDTRTFEEWCQDQTGDVRTLFDDCERRCVLFNNRTKDKVKMEAQRENLFSVVASIKQLYTLDEYKKAVKGQTEILVQSKLPEVEKHKNGVMSEVWRELGTIDQKYPAASCDCLALACLLSNLENQLLELKKFISEKDKNTGVLQHLFCDINIAEMRIHTKRQIVEQKLQILASSATMVICFLDDFEFDLEKITETITIRKCSIDKDGNIRSKSVSGQGVSGYRMDLIEICKTISSSQQVTETLDLHGQLSHSGEVCEVSDQDSPPKDRGEVAKDVDQDSPPKDKTEVAKDVDQDSPPKDRGEVAKDVDQDSPPKDRGEVAKDVDQDSPPKDKTEVAKDVDQDSPPKDRGEVVKDMDQDSPPKDRGLAAKDLGQDSPPKDRRQVTVVNGQNPQRRDDQRVAKGRGPQPKGRGKVIKGNGHAGHRKPINDLETTKRMFKTVINSLKHDNLTRVICLISKYEQKLTKEEVKLVIKKVETTYGISEIKNHSILILTCDNDNLEAEKAQMLEDWRKEEPGANTRLLNACGNRCVLLNPMTKNEGTLRDGGLAPSTQLAATSKPNTAPENSWSLTNVKKWAQPLMFWKSK